MPRRRRAGLCLQGPTELLPVSSSAPHDPDPVARGLAPIPSSIPSCASPSRSPCTRARRAALAIDMRAELIDAARGLRRRRAAVIALSLAPPVLAGYVLERPIERRLGGPRSIATGLIAGAVAMALADLRAATATRGARRDASRRRTLRRAGARRRPGRGADPRRVAQRRDAHGRASPRVRAARTPRRCPGTRACR